jgi:hypothetical protein
MGVESYSYGRKVLLPGFFSFKKASSHPMFFATASMCMWRMCNLVFPNALFNAFQEVQIDSSVLGVLARSRLSHTV